ncbi:hypothetical protein [Paenibacillus taichungensis]|uniref:hypothetical protein n=1 Tax=Paenibacillus taichungensis TaxID=484184 RepID=UPI0035D8535D
MDEELVIDKLILEVKDYANGRAKDVARGAESPRLAALLLQKYGLGVISAVSLIFDSPRAADPILEVLDQETAKIDARWREHDRERWSWRPADLTSLNPEGL